MKHGAHARYMAACVDMLALTMKKYEKNSVTPMPTKPSVRGSGGMNAATNRPIVQMPMIVRSPPGRRACAHEQQQATRWMEMGPIVGVRLVGVRSAVWYLVGHQTGARSEAVPFPFVPGFGTPFGTTCFSPCAIQ